jgi:hypothetical protein
MDRRIFGRWVILRRSMELDRSGNRPWVICKCLCGTVKRVNMGSLQSGASTSCGCYRRELLSKIKQTHGLTKTAEYRVWQNMLNRCYNRNVQGYHNYGGRQLTVCRRWRSFTNFLADMGKRPPGRRMTIERKKNDVGYNPDNCCWIEHRVNSRNKRNTIYVRPGLSLVEACERIGMRYKTGWRQFKEGRFTYADKNTD